MLIHNNATGHSNGELWNLNAEKIFSESQGDKVNLLPLESKNEINLFQRFILNAKPLNREKHVFCVHFRFQNTCFTFW